MLGQNAESPLLVGETPALGGKTSGSSGSCTENKDISK